MKFTVASMLLASATALFGTDMATSPYLLGTMLDGKLKPKQQIPLVMAAAGSKSPALPFLLNGELDDDELEFAHFSGVFTGYPDSTGVTQRILPFLAGDYADQEENTLPLMMLASENPVGYNTGDVVEILYEDKDFISEKDYYMFDQLMGGKPKYVENPILARNMFKKKREDKYLTTKDFMNKALLNEAGQPGNFYIMDQLISDHKVGGAKEFVVGEDFSFYRDLARGANEGLVYDFLEDKDEITGKDLRMVESLKPAEEFNPFIFNSLNKNEVMQNKDLLKINLVSQGPEDEFKILDYHHLDDKRNKITTPSNFFRYSGVTGKDAGKFYRDTLPGGVNDLTMGEYIKLAELKGDNLNPLVAEALFDSSDDLNEKNLYVLNAANGGDVTDPIEAYQALDDDDQFDKVDLKVYEAMQKGLPAKQGLLWDVMDEDDVISQTDLVTLTKLQGVDVPLVVEEIFDSSDDEVTNEDMMKIQALTGDGTVNPLLLAKSSRKEKPLTPEDFLAFSAVKPGVRPGDQGGLLEDMLDNGIVTMEDLKLPLLVSQSSQGRPGTFNDFIPGSMSLSPKTKIDRDVYPWAMVSGNYDPYFVDPNVDSAALVRWTTGGRFNAPEPKPLPEPEPEVYYVRQMVSQPVRQPVPVRTAAPIRTRSQYVRPSIYNGRASRGVGPYGYPLRAVSTENP